MRAKATTQTVREDETPGDLPEGWALAPAGDVFTFVTSGSRGWAQYYAETGALFLRIANLNHDDIAIDLSQKKYVNPPRSAEGTRTRVKLRDLLISITADVGMVGLVKHDLGEAYINQHIALARLAEGLDDAYVSWYIASTGGQKQLGDLQRGATKVGLGLDDIRSINLPFAPLVEQRRIVAKIDELLEKVNVSRERLAKVPKILRAFRQAVLASACSGRLTEDWRTEEANTKDIAPIISSIQKRRESEANSPKEKERIRQIYTQSEEGDSGELPEGWGFVRLNKLCSSFEYGTSAKSQPSGKVPVLRMGNIQGGKINWTDLAYSSDRDEIRQYELTPQTVLFNRTNSPELVGKTAIYLGEHPAIFAGYLIKINRLPEIDARYLNFCLNTNYARDFCSRVKTDAVGQSNINAQKLGTFEVPFCTLGEQHEIARRVEALFKLADAIEMRVATWRTEKLTQAILAKAFRGELVPTEAELARRERRTYEPASALLARIRTATNEDSNNGAPSKQEKRTAK